MTRDKFTIKFTRPVVSNKQGLQLSTPEIVAKYIAKRLKTSVIADLGCGIGGQVIFFGKECEKVYAVERCHEKLEYAKKNCDLYNVRNVEFILGDALSQEVKNKIKDADIIFSDPARTLSEKERTLSDLEPPILEVIKMYSDITPDLAFHAPPQIRSAHIDFDCEREYLSLNGQLNRLTLYLGDLKKCGRSAVILPEGEHLDSSEAPPILENPPNKYVYEPEPSIVKAGLLNELAQNMAGKGNELFFCKGDEKRTLLTSQGLLDSPFLKDRYLFLKKTEMDITRLKKILDFENAKNVVLRLDIQPEKYWDFRNSIEKGLTGSRTLHVFGFGKDVLICEKIKK